MGDMGDYWRDVKPHLKEESRKKKKGYAEHASSELVRLNIRHSWKSATHVVITHAGLTVDYWPTTGKWGVRGTNRYSRGLKPLLGRISQEEKKHA